MAATRDTSQRRLQISELVRQHGSVQVAALARRFGVSMQTVRKDLRYLAPNVTQVIWPLSRVTFIEIMPASEDEKIIGFVRE